MSIAKDTLDRIAQDPEARRLIRDREDSIRLHQMSLAASRIEWEARGRAEGEAKGRAEGEARGRAQGEAKGEARGRSEILLKLLGLRFGPPSEQTRALVEAATAPQIEIWAERVLTAATVDEVLAP